MTHKSRKKSSKTNSFGLYIRLVLAFALVLAMVVFSVILVQQQIQLIDEGGADLEESGVASKDFLAEFSQLSEVQQEILLDAKPHDTVEDRLRYSRLLDSHAKTSQLIDISTCVAVPLVSRVDYNKEVIFQNNHTEERVIKFGNRMAIAIPPQTAAVVEDLYDRGQGLYSFGCDTIDHSIGVLIVEDGKN